MELGELSELLHTTVAAYHSMSESDCVRTIFCSQVHLWATIALAYTKFTLAIVHVNIDFCLLQCNCMLYAALIVHVTVNWVTATVLLLYCLLLQVLYHPEVI